MSWLKIAKCHLIGDSTLLSRNHLRDISNQRRLLTFCSGYRAVLELWLTLKTYDIGPTYQQFCMIDIMFCPLPIRTTLTFWAIISSKISLMHKTCHKGCSCEFVLCTGLKKCSIWSRRRVVGFIHCRSYICWWALDKSGSSVRFANAIGRFRPRQRKWCWSR